MADYWMVPRNKRSLIPVPLVLSLMAASALDREWTLQVGLDFERRLEQYHLKSAGTRRDQGGGGARTYRAMMTCLGLIFCEEETGFYRLTRAGERIVNGESPVAILRNQLLKMQYPSVYSVRQNVVVDVRFRVHPFRLLLTLMMRAELMYLTQEEIARFVATEGTSDSEDCVEQIVQPILAYRQGDDSLAADFAARFRSRVGVRTVEKTLGALRDVANTFINYMEYAQLAVRDEEKHLVPVDADAVRLILSQPQAFNRHSTEQAESFQRSFGLGPGDARDNRRFGEQNNVQRDQVAARLVGAAFHSRAIVGVLDASDEQLVRDVAAETGLPEMVVRRHLRAYSGREREILASAYVAMAYAGRDEATEFERATANLMGAAGFGFNAAHVGGPGAGRMPDVHVADPTSGAAGIIDTKAYARYTICHDHQNRMAHSYVPHYRQRDGERLQFIMYVSGGFGTNFGMQLRALAESVGLGGIGMTAADLLVLAEHAHSGREEAMRRRMIELAQERRLVAREDFPLD